MTSHTHPTPTATATPIGSRGDALSMLSVAAAAAVGSAEAGQGPKLPSFGAAFGAIAAAYPVPSPLSGQMSQMSQAEQARQQSTAAAVGTSHQGQQRLPFNQPQPPIHHHHHHHPFQHHHNQHQHNYHQQVQHHPQVYASSQALRHPQHSRPQSHPDAHRSPTTTQQRFMVPPTSGCVRATRAQLKVLEAIFAENPLPSTQMHNSIAERINMSKQSVRNWFQNQRAKVRRAANEGDKDAAVKVALLNQIQMERTQMKYAAPPPSNSPTLSHEPVSPISHNEPSNQELPKQEPAHTYPPSFVIPSSSSISSTYPSYSHSSYHYHQSSLSATPSSSSTPPNTSPHSIMTLVI
ncbi:hypothetical protein BCR33DRAFT_711650 [Rhizoclosmatium globosum]|uniref:Homeobox domain-containing protein n=1 Tax=Rhizoclosmatium globosum TaxID=329046 RepID=A0A1Y2CZL3_9FUNG|nr:hypothetical protein BCR33DRAFT_711650 [Rhizoclosmatium globosum]|eukprot:ORY52314.1 hypothetical protein BCR33DRAFT_711650 [Rhizoclosmatium globosum]